MLALVVVAIVGSAAVGVLAWVAAEDRSVYYTEAYVPEERN